jgi:hypothetical protein
MLTVSTALAAGQTVKFHDLGNFVRVLASTEPLTIRAYKNGQVLTDSPNISAGYAEQYEDHFDAVEVYSALAQTVQIAIRFGSMVFFDQSPTGNVTLTNPTETGGAFTQSRVDLTNVNQQLLAANTARRYLLIQNNDSSAVMRVTLHGIAATVTQGLRIPAGGLLEIPNYAVTGAVNAIMETATANTGNVEIVTG